MLRNLTEFEAIKMKFKPNEELKLQTLSFAIALHSIKEFEYRACKILWLVITNVACCMPSSEVVLYPCKAIGHYSSDSRVLQVFIVAG